VDGVIGGDTHSQVHQLELAGPTGAVIARVSVGNDAAGFAAAVAWILLGAHREVTDTKTRHANQLRALLLTGEDADRELARGKFTVGRLDRIAARRPRGGETREQAVRREQARRLALACKAAHRELSALRRQLLAVIECLAPAMTDQRGVGPISAAALLLGFSHPGRCRDEAAFAALAGANPVPASSGKTTRHRLNRGGDRQLNRALHDIARSRMRHCALTRAYVERRTAEGKTTNEIRRCLKRYIARQQFRFMTAAMA
jgi:transposase